MCFAVYVLFGTGLLGRKSCVCVWTVCVLLCELLCVCVCVFVCVYVCGLCVYLV